MSGVTDPVLSRALSAFTDRFGGAPRWGASAPGRVNLIGEHTDYNSGLVMPFAIERRCVVVAAPASDAGVSRLFSAELDDAIVLDLRAVLRPMPHREARTPLGAFAGYAAGVLAQFQKQRGGGLENIDVAIASNVPLGGGVSSSAALEVALSRVAEQAYGIELDPLERALLCRRADHEFVGVPCGIMDQLASSAARAGSVMLIDCRDNSFEQLPAPRPGQAEFMVIDTRTRHSHASGEYGARAAACRAAAAALGVPTLREATEPLLNRHAQALSEDQRRLARHVVRENARVFAAAEALRLADFVRLGRLMNESHDSLRDDYRVSSPELDLVACTCRALPGVYGARMTGGGFGGCAIALARPGAAAELTARLLPLYKRTFGIDCGVFTTAAADGARTLEP